MTLVDSSVWIDFFNGRGTLETDHLDALLGTDVAATGDLILVEVLQGFRDESDFVTARRLLSKCPSFDLLGSARAVLVAGRYRELRKAGVTVRKTIGVVIGSFCIDEGIPLLFSDRDFLPMVEHLGLVPAIRPH